MRQASINQQSITSFAQKKAKELSLKILFAGVLSTFFLGLFIGAYYYHGQLSQTLSVVSKSLGQPLGYGGDFLPTQIIRTLVGPGNFKDAWVTIPGGDVHLEEHFSKSQLDFNNVRSRGYYFVGGIPHILVSEPIVHNNNNLGKLYVGYRVPILTIFLFAIFVCFLFSVIACYLYIRILALAKNVATPFKEYSIDLDNHENKERFLESAQGATEFSEISTFNRILLDYIKVSKKNESLARKAISKAQIAKVSTRVRHDVINSLVIGKSALDRLDSSNEYIGIIKSVFEGIGNTVEDIPKLASLTTDEMNLAAVEADSDTSENLNESVRPCHINAYVRQIIGEIRFSSLCRGKEIKFDVSCEELSFHSFCEVQPNKLKRNLVNLYKNAIESIPTEGTIKTTIFLDEETVSISIQDNGQGMTKDILSKIGHRGVTFGKINGCGIGLSSAIEDVSRWGGELIVSSVSGEGTIIKIDLPQAEENYLFPTRLSFAPKMKVVVIDDDFLVRRLWKNRFSKVNFKENLVDTLYGKNIADAKNIIARLEKDKDDYILLIDNDLKDEKSTGFDFVRDMKIEAKSILVTSSGNSSKLYERCSEVGLPIIPKSIQEQIPIEICV